MADRNATTIEFSGDVRRVVTSAAIPGHPGKFLKLADVLDAAAPSQVRCAGATDAYGQIVARHRATIDSTLALIEREGFAAYEAALKAQETLMQHVTASDYMTGSAKAAVDAALADAKTQVVGGGAPTTPDATRPTPEAALAPRGGAR